MKSIKTYFKKENISAVFLLFNFSYFASQAIKTINNPTPPLTFSLYLVGALIEFIFIYFLTLTLIRSDKKFLQNLALPILILFSAIYFSQSYTLRQSGCLIDIIALENAHHFMLVLTDKLRRKLFEFSLIFLVFALAFVFAKASSQPVCHSKILKFSGALLLLQVPLSGFLLSLSPAVDLTVKASHLAAPLASAYRFRNRTPDFIKQKVYETPFPYERLKNIDKPNVFLFFTEGLSARSIGTYNPRFKNVMPNLDEFAKKSLVVENYYNHTAATEKGILGQLTSFYPARTRDFHPEVMQTPEIPENNYRSLAHILEENGYETYFLMASTGVTDNLPNIAKSAGFKNVVGTEELRKLLNSDESGNMSDEDFFKAAKIFLENLPPKKPVFVAFYNLETHAFKDTAENGIKYGNGKNRVLNTLTNFDFHFGKFFNYFKKSKFSNNSFFFFTTDHAHFFEPPYIELMKNEKDFKPVFVDRIPLFIYAPTIKQPKALDAKGKNSLALAPTILHYLGVKYTKNHFIGYSLLEKNASKMLNVSETGLIFFLTDEHGVHEEKNLPEHMKNDWKKAKDNVMFCIYSDIKGQITEQKERAQKISPSSSTDAKKN